MGAAQVYPPSISSLTIWLHSDKSGQSLKLQRFGDLVCMRSTNQGPMAGTSVYISELPSGFGSTLYLSTEDCCSSAKQKHQRCFMGAEWSRPVWATADAQTREDQHRAKQICNKQSRANQPGAEQAISDLDRAARPQDQLTALQHHN